MSFYAVFDGHGGTTAACYCLANFHNFLSQNYKLSKRTDEALRETFLKTDKHYAEKSVQQVVNVVNSYRFLILLNTFFYNYQCFTSGSCALCAVYKIKEKKLFVGWLGDSQALLVKKGRLWQIVQKHSPAYEVSYFNFGLTIAVLIRRPDQTFASQIGDSHFFLVKHKKSESLLL